MPRLTPGSPNSPQNSPVGPGIALLDQIDLTVDGVIKAMQGDESKGKTLGALTAAPSFTASPEYINRMESLVGQPGSFKGAQRIVTTEATMELEIAELTNDNFKAIHPGLDSTSFLNSMHGYVTIGTGASKISFTARTSGVGGNSITVTMTAAVGAAAPTTVAVSGNAITVTLGTASAGVSNATVDEVVAVVNRSTAAKALVKAGRGIGSDGSGVVAAAASTPLAGGTAGVKTGTKLLPKGYISNSDYFDNITMALEGQDQTLKQIWILYNVISLDEISFSPDDGGDISSIGASFTGHVTADQLDTNLGIYRPPYAVVNFDNVPVV